MSKSERMSAVMQPAWAMVRRNGMSLGEAMRTAWRNIKVKAAMLAGRAVRFVYRKADGSLREAVGTLARAAINYIPNGNGRRTPEHLQLYWDLGEGAYRCFDKSRLMAICG